MINQILQGNAFRCQKLFGCHNQLTGEGMDGARSRIEIADHDIPVQFLTDEVLNTQIYKEVASSGTIKRLVESRGLKASKKTIDDFRLALHFVRCLHDPSFAFATMFKIKDKISGEMIPFHLNYAQRILLTQFEEMRREGKPIKLVLLKARQWGGSTLTQLYMAWIQMFVKEGWNSLIVAQTKDTARRIKAMYTKVLKHFPKYVFQTEELKFSPSERSAADYVVTDRRGRAVRNNVVTVSSFENYESTRGSDFAMAHYSEVAYWMRTPQKSAEDLIRAVSSGIAEGVPLTLEVIESTANGKSGFFHDEYQEAKQGRSSRRALFIPFFFIENDMMHFDDEKSLKEFAVWLYNNRNKKITTTKTEESGEYLWGLWLKGATLEHIKWYVERRKSFHEHAQMASEAPSDDVECFTFSGKLMVSPYIIDAMEKLCVKMPVWRGDIDLIDNRHDLQQDDNGAFLIWEYPDEKRYEDRYVVVVDVGGDGNQSDFSVITVIDRINEEDSDHPLFNGWREGLQTEKGLKVVARWRGHLRYDLMALKAVAISQFYDEALLAFESNTFDRNKALASKFGGENDHILGILNTIGNRYGNLYMRTNKKGDELKEGIVSKIGFQTNRHTKQLMVDLFRKAFEDGLFHDPDERVYKELNIYEQRPDGSYGNIPGAGNHDDIVMTDMIACVISKEMPPTMPARIIKSRNRSGYRTYNESCF